ncbi:protein-cysteine N-palmitoyltransferase Rasp [Eurytemora carolleeae]|uniref:protein-cysteine N-palmitoyltransferase Rasp n=1 Tax=Eurytemora carolleeae TaxID=1294199 RepID=UPI000C761F2C|nr:protein-cysteine N-palmitoyltransferase Rasp [Eurytemora carolleeae]|eukprot:XP_023327881.1 protein-cysteine N-palmitoyltransferase Rasp-like [Eurytemora affinis]
MWALCGMGYLMGQFFQLKYVVMYGCGSFIAKLDSVDAPPHPKCIARIHLYSEMWRYFDVGLHEFMHNYIFQPLTKLHSSLPGKLVYSVICFSFVYIWHGTYDFVLIWSILNCTGIQI